MAYERLNKPVHAETPDDPRRCQGNTKAFGGVVGQCPFIAIEGEIYCAYCQQEGTQKRKRKQEQRMYLLGQWQGRVSELANGDQVKSLTQEIGILRLMLEKIINRCEDDTALEIKTPAISELVLKIEKVVRSCHSLELQSGKLLDKAQILHLASMILGIISDVMSTHINDPQLQEKINAEIADKVIAGIAELGPSDAVKS